MFMAIKVRKAYYSKQKQSKTNQHVGKKSNKFKEIRNTKQLIQVKKLSEKTEDSCFNTRNKQVKENIK